MSSAAADKARPRIKRARVKRGRALQHRGLVPRGARESPPQTFSAVVHQSTRRTARETLGARLKAPCLHEPAHAHFIFDKENWTERNMGDTWKNLSQKLLRIVRIPRSRSSIFSRRDSGNSKTKTQTTIRLTCRSPLML